MKWACCTSWPWLHLQGHFIFICFAPIHVHPCPCNRLYANISRIPVQQWTCTLVRWMHSHPAAEKINVRHASKSLCCLKKNQDAPRPSEHPPVPCLKKNQNAPKSLLFHCCTGKEAKTKLHQEYPHRKKRIPPLTGPLFPIGIEHLIYMNFFCYGSSNGY